MRKIKLYIGISLNGKIARKNGEVDWLDAIPHPEGEDYGYYAFYETIDATLIGYSTYAQVINWGVDWPYPDKKNYVITTQKELKNTEFVEFISADHISKIQEIKNADGKDIWLVGGGKLNAMLLNENMIDEIYVHIMPYIIPDGIELFTDLLKDQLLTLVDHKSYSSGVTEMIYNLKQ